MVLIYACPIGFKRGHVGWCVVWFWESRGFRILALLVGDYDLGFSGSGTEVFWKCLAFACFWKGEVIGS